MNTLNKLTKAASFAAKRHTGQTRKGERGVPYINHPLEVASILSEVGKIDDVDILTAAVLHDTIEDTGTTKEEIKELFGERVCGFVLEVTDDKSLPKQERKRLQIEHAPHLSTEAKQIKLADKISNVTEIANDPPADWSQERRLQYVDWAESVIAGVRGVNESLEAKFDEAAANARARFS